MHFVVEPQNQKGLSRLFCALNTKYIRYFQKKYGESVGCLDDEYFYEAILYVELNPFVVEMESKPGEYYWSIALERLKTRSLYYSYTLPT